MKRIVLDIDKIESCKKNLVQLRNETPFFGVVEIKITGKEVGNCVFKMIDLNDDFVAKSFSNSYCYEPLFIKSWLRYLKKTKGSILDIGASTGLYSLLSQAYARNRTVCAFEPYSRAYSRLVSNKDVNQFAKIRVFPYAISNVSSTGTLSIKNFEGPITTAGHISLAQDPKTLHLPIQIKKITDVIDPDVQVGQIKIDTEGFEIQVLDSLKEIITKWRPVVFFECLTLNNFERLNDCFKRLTYDIFAIRDTTKKIELATSFVNDCTNYIASPPQHTT